MALLKEELAKLHNLEERLASTDPGVQLMVPQELKKLKAEFTTNEEMLKEITALEKRFSEKFKANVNSVETKAIASSASSRQGEYKHPEGRSGQGFTGGASVAGVDTRISQVSGGTQTSLVNPTKALWSALKQQDWDNVIKAIQAGADVNTAGGFYKNTPLMEAASYARLDVIKELIAFGADVKVESSDGWTPLHYAAKNNEDLRVSMLLIENGADIDLANKWNDTPLSLAKAKDREDLVEKANEKNPYRHVLTSIDNNFRELVKLKYKYLTNEYSDAYNKWLKLRKGLVSCIYINNINDEMGLINALNTGFDQNNLNINITQLPEGILSLETKTLEGETRSVKKITSADLSNKDIDWLIVHYKDEMTKINNREKYKFAMGGVPDNELYHLFIDKNRLDHPKDDEEKEAEPHRMFDVYEPGYFDAMVGAFKLMSDNIGVENNLELIKELHDAAVKNVFSFRYPESKTDKMEFTEGIKYLGQYYGVNKRKIEKGAIDELTTGRVLFAPDEIKERLTTMTTIPPQDDSYLLDLKPRYLSVIKNEDWGEIYIASQLRDETVLKQSLAPIFLHYKTSIGNVSSLNGKLKAIAEFLRALEVAHFFPDGNQRTYAFLLLNKLLIENNIPPAILDDPYMFDGYYTVETMAKHIRKGINNFLKQTAVHQKSILNQCNKNNESKISQPEGYLIDSGGNYTPFYEKCKGETDKLILEYYRAHTKKTLDESDYITSLGLSSDEFKKEFKELGVVQDMLYNKIKSREDFVRVLDNCTPQEKSAVIVICKDKLHDIIQSTDDLIKVLRDLTLEECKVVCDSCKDNLPEIIQSGEDFVRLRSSLCNDLGTKERTALFDSFKDRLPNIFQSTYDLKFALQFLFFEEKKVLIDSFKDKLHKIIRSTNDFKEILGILGDPSLEKEVIGNCKDKLINIVQSASDFDSVHAAILNSKNQKVLKNALLASHLTQYINDTNTKSDSSSFQFFGSPSTKKVEIEAANALINALESESNSLVTLDNVTALMQGTLRETLQKCLAITDPKKNIEEFLQDYVVSATKELTTKEIPIEEKKSQLSEKKIVKQIKPEKVDDKDIQANGLLLSDAQIAIVKETLKDKPDGRYSKKLLGDKSTAATTMPFGVIKSAGKFYAVYYGQKKNKHLGIGGFGKVKIIQDLDTGLWGALKIVLNTGISETSFASVKAEHAKLKEVKKAYGECFSRLKEKSGIETKKFHIMMELASGIELFQLEEQIPNMSALEQIDMGIAILEAVNNFHVETGYIHRDIKPENLFYNETTKQATLIDFGFADKLGKNGNVLGGIKGTPEFMEPSLLQAWLTRKNQFLYTKDVDDYAVGRVLQEILGFPAKYYDRKQNKVVLHGSRGQIKVPEVKSVIDGLLVSGSKHVDIVSAIASFKQQRDILLNQDKTVVSGVSREEEKHNLNSKVTLATLSQEQRTEVVRIKKSIQEELTLFIEVHLKSASDPKGKKFQLRESLRQCLLALKKHDNLEEILAAYKLMEESLTKFITDVNKSRKVNADQAQQPVAIKKFFGGLDEVGEIRNLCLFSKSGLTGIIQEMEQMMGVSNKLKM